jgi:hypothetical protein
VSWRSKARAPPARHTRTTRANACPRTLCSTLTPKPRFAPTRSRPPLLPPAAGAEIRRRERALEDEIARARTEAEADASRSAAGKLCATPYGIDVVGITEAIALLGATVGGVSARQRKVELEEVNEKLRAINISLRQQARAGVVYAPGEPRFRENTRCVAHSCGEPSQLTRANACAFLRVR